MNTCRKTRARYEVKISRVSERKRKECDRQLDRDDKSREKTDKSEKGKKMSLVELDER